MTNFQITHPHAQTAVLLASFNEPDRAWVTRMLAESGTPRSLYTRARLLRAQQTMDEIEAMHSKMERATNTNSYGLRTDAPLLGEKHAA